MLSDSRHGTLQYDRFALVNWLRRKCFNLAFEVKPRADCFWIGGLKTPASVSCQIEFPKAVLKLVNPTSILKSTGADTVTKALKSNAPMGLDDLVGSLAFKNVLRELVNVCAPACGALMGKARDIAQYVADRVLTDSFGLEQGSRAATDGLTKLLFPELQKRLKEIQRTVRWSCATVCGSLFCGNFWDSSDRFGYSGDPSLRLSARNPSRSSPVYPAKPKAFSRPC
jgi:hypothetical protein